MIKRLSIAITVLFAGFTLNAQGELLPPAELADENGAFVEINSVEIYYVAEGPEDGPVVLLLHGFGGATVTWNDTLPALAEAGYRAIAYDRPPFGLSDKSPEIDYTDAAQIEYAIQFMDTLEIESAVLVGHSQGGGVTAQIAAAHPDRVRAMVLVSAAVQGTSSRLPKDEGALFTLGGSGLEQLFTLIEGIDPQSQLAQTLIQRFLSPEQFADILSSAYADPADATPERRAGYGRVLQVEGWPAGFLAYLIGSSVRDSVDMNALDAYSLPTLIVWGEADDWVPLQDGEWLNQVLTGSQLVTYPEVGHLPMEENTEQFNSDLINFINNTP